MENILVQSRTPAAMLSAPFLVLSPSFLGGFIFRLGTGAGSRHGARLQYPNNIAAVPLPPTPQMRNQIRLFVGRIMVLHSNLILASTFPPFCTIRHVFL